MPRINIDGRRITDHTSFHAVFAEVFGFPDFYGCNMNAWIDCMTDLDDPDTGMTTVHGSASDPVVLHIDHVDSLPQDTFDDLVECAAFVNWRRLELGEPAILILSFYRCTMRDEHPSL